MGRSPLEWLCFFIAVVRPGSSLAAHIHISHAKDILAPVCDRFMEGFCDCGHAEHTGPPRLAAAASSVALIAGDGHAREVFAAMKAAGYGEPHEHANRSASRQAPKCARWLSHGAARSDTEHGGPARPNNQECHELSGVRHGHPGLW